MLAAYVCCGFGFLSTLIMGLIAWGLRTQLELLRSEFHLALSGSEVRFVEVASKAQAQIELLRSELHLALGASELRFFQLVNGKYVTREVLDLRLVNCPLCKEQRLERIEKAA